MAFDISDDELVTLLETLEAQRDALLAERTKQNLPLFVLREGDALPDAATLDGKLTRIGFLFLRLQGEYARREVARADDQRQQRMLDAAEERREESIARVIFDEDTFFDRKM